MAAWDGVNGVSAALTCENCAGLSAVSHSQRAVILLQTSTSKSYV